MTASTARLPYSREFNFGRVVRHLGRLKLDPQAAAIVLALHFIQRDRLRGHVATRTLYCSGAQLAARARISERTYWRRLPIVEKLGLVRVLHGGGRGTLPDGKIGGYANGFEVDPVAVAAHSARPPAMRGPLQQRRLEQAAGSAAALPAPARRPLAEELERIRLKARGSP